MVLILFLLLFFTGPETTAAKEDYRYAVLNVKINGQTKNATGILDFEECGYEAYKKVAFAFELHANETHVLECTLIWNFTRFERSPLEKDAKEGKLYFIVDKRDHEEGICEKERNESVREVLADFGKCLGNSRICHDLEHVEHGTISFEELKKKCASEGEGGVPIKWNESSSHDNLDEKESGKSYEIHKVGCKVDTVNSIYW
ncbi:hypothetical protein QR680_007204 [Steinernema hermaphroditum]|uniref:Uncharacterized protein n=1 Tax=Steinernema hermaphroditum TaxID=289476 RepID=A0AA39HZ86_9BILA|nr:hypothetical protein QR680_007204 [Steinernema hermaphroditum]